MRMTHNSSVMQYVNFWCSSTQHQKFKISLWWCGFVLQHYFENLFRKGFLYICCIQIHASLAKSCFDSQRASLSSRSSSLVHYRTVQNLTSTILPILYNGQVNIWILSTTVKQGSCVGLLQVAGLETVLGTEHYWAMMLSLSLIPALTQYLVLPFCPESPRYLLINQGEESKAEAGGSHWLWCFNFTFHMTGHIISILVIKLEWHHRDVLQRNIIERDPA